jgi:hypothetical protein
LDNCKEELSSCISRHWTIGRRKVMSTQAVSERSREALQMEIKGFVSSMGWWIWLWLCQEMFRQKAPYLFSGREHIWLGVEICLRYNLFLPDATEMSWLVFQHVLHRTLVLPDAKKRLGGQERMAWINKFCKCLIKQDWFLTWRLLRSSINT